MTTAVTTTPAAAPKVGKTVSVRVDAQFAEDLEVLMKTGFNASEAVKYCANMLAVAYHRAWQQGICEEGEVPEELRIVNVKEWNDLVSGYWKKVVEDPNARAAVAN